MTKVVKITYGFVGETTHCPECRGFAWWDAEIQHYKCRKCDIIYNSSTQSKIKGDDE